MALPLRCAASLRLAGTVSKSFAVSDRSLPVEDRKGGAGAPAGRTLAAHGSGRANRDCYPQLGTKPQGTMKLFRAVIGEDQQALEWLEKARPEHHPWLTQLGVDPQFDALKSEP